MDDRLVEICKEMVEQQKRSSKMLFAALVISILINLAIVGAFLYYEAGYNYSGSTTVTTEQQTDGDSSIVNGNQYNDEAQDRSN